MKRYMNHHASTRHLLPFVLVASLVLPMPALAASVALATAPLATSTTSTVKPNVLFVLDDSGSMSWTYMPDAADDFRGKVGYHSSQCNAVYYNPGITYRPPVDAAGANYADASFTAAKDGGFDSSSTARNLDSAFIANRFEPEVANTYYKSNGSYLLSSLGPYAAHYYTYSGSQTTRNFSDTSSTFYTECNNDFGAIAGNSSNVFTKISLSSTAAATTATIVVSGSNSTSVSSLKINGTQEIMNGTTTANSTSSTVADRIKAQINFCTSAKVGNCTTVGGHGYTATLSDSTVTITGLADTASSLIITKDSGTMTLLPTIFPKADDTKLKNFANWYSYYRTRMLMMKTAAGHAFSNLNNGYRVGLSRINSSSTMSPTLGAFENTQRTNWYSALYGATAYGGTPLRKALANAGKYYAGKLSGTDPVQYSCQQNFTILSTDGYWSTGSSDKGFDLDGNDVGNQDGTADKPMWDGYQATTTVTITYTRDNYSTTTSGCSGSKKMLKTQPEIGSCKVSVVGTPTGSEICNPSSWSKDGSSYTSGSCASSISWPGGSDPSAKVEKSRVTTPGSVGGTSDTLADVAMYYYKTDLRTTVLGNCGGAAVSPELEGPLCKNNVFISSTDNNTQQHMTTFTLGLGASGKMIYSTSYLSDSSGDYVAVKLGSTASSSVCTWQSSGTVCTWPNPASGDPQKIDDLWHAAVNGRGAFFSASDPTSLSAGLSGALAGINARKGSAAAAATSTLNPVAGNNYAYVASYTTVKWQGNLEARGINTDTGAVNENATWCAENVVGGACNAPSTVLADDSGDTTTYYCVTPNSVTCADGKMDGTDCRVPMATACTGTMPTTVADVSDTRTIKTANSTGTALVNFTYANLTATQKAYFASANIGTLSQWSSLDATQQTAAAGTNLVNYIRGQYGFEDRSANAVSDHLYRKREAVLGDALESQPAFMSKPVFSYPYPGYSAYVTAQASRAGTVYMGANDGMMHAFAADTGIERWAYVPSMVIPSLWKLADTNYATLHRNYVNGSPTTSDIYCPGNCGGVVDVTYGNSASWRTILVAGLNGGGRGYYALDITVPGTPTLLWEVTPTTGIGIVKDADMGYSFGQPIITRKADGTWVVLVSSGYNNTLPGNGKGYLYVLNASTGAIISKIATNVGDTTTPSGLAKIAAWNDEPAGNQVGYVYGGDLLGNIWRFDINSTVAATVADGEIGTGDVLQFATLFSDTAGTSAQPITTTPVLGKIAGKRVVFIGTGKYLETGDLTTTQVQTQYAIKDDNATSTLVNPRNSLVKQTLSDNTDGSATRLTTGNAVSFYAGRGWYIDFPDSGERVNIDSKLVEGTLLVPTIVPSNTACSPGGYGWLNFLDYKTGGAINSATSIASLKYDSTIVGVNVLYIDGAPMVGVVTSTDPTPKINEDVGFAAVAAGFTGKRVIWRELIP
ncbi:MAG TPA: PilC/PilY family type IV pilus protein [Gallionella sp.]|nr:PilC/PilY family type IV pilus protein [Gallionella sp.]